MAFERLQDLGKDRFNKIINDLMTGKSAVAVSRMIQQEWAEFQDVAEKTLVQQVNRLRHAAAKGMFGDEIAQQIVEGATPQIEFLKDVSAPVLERLEKLAAIQEERVKFFVDREKAKGAVLSGPIISSATSALTEYRELLKDIQKMRFELGLEEFKGMVSIARGAIQRKTMPDGTSIEHQLIEAFSTVEGVLDRRASSLQNR